MPTGSDYSRVDFSNRGNTADYKDRQSEGRTGEFTQYREDLYQPLLQEQIAYANGTPVQHTRPTPPPLVHGSNPESSFNQMSLEERHWATKPNGQFEYSLADLRKEIIRQQLGGQ